MQQDITEHLRENPGVLRALEEHQVLVLGVPMTLGQVAVLLCTLKQTPCCTAIEKTSLELPFTSLPIRVTGA